MTIRIIYEDPQEKLFSRPLLLASRLRFTVPVTFPSLLLEYMELDLCFSHSKCIWPHSQCPDFILVFILLFFIFLLLLFLHFKKKLLYSFTAALHKKDCKYICLIWVNVVSPLVLSNTDKEKVRPHTSFGAWESFTEFGSLLKII